VIAGKRLAAFAQNIPTSRELPETEIDRCMPAILHELFPRYAKATGVRVDRYNHRSRPDWTVRSYRWFSSALAVLPDSIAQQHLPVLNTRFIFKFAGFKQAGMQVKHTFLLVFVLSLVWCGVMFANLSETATPPNITLAPNIASNNIFNTNPDNTPSQSCSCHGSPSKATLMSGLPTEWVPNTDYHITVTVPAGGTTYGFELSAVYNSGGNVPFTQAGTISIEGGDPATTVVGTGTVAGVTFALSRGSGSGTNRHAPTQNVYHVQWHSPATTGAVRFDVGGVRSNDQRNSTGDSAFGESRILQAAETIAPTLTILTPTTNATFATNTTPITLTGSASDNVGVAQVTWTSDRTAGATCTGTTNWTCSNISLLAGANVLTVKASDAAGNIGQDVLTVTLDNTPPTVTITSPTPNPTFDTSSSPITLMGSASDNVGVTSVMWTNDRGGTANCAGTTAWTCSNIALLSGPNVLTIRAVDAVTNAGTDTLTVTLTSGTQPPTLSGVSPLAGAQGANVNVTLTGTAFLAGMTVNAGSGITVSNVNVASSVSATATFAIASGAALGSRNVTVTTGNGTSGAVTFTVNPPAPTLSLVSPASGVQGANVNVTLTGTAFLAGMTVNAGSGITVSNVNVGSSVSATATFAIASNAALGARNVTVTTTGGTSAAATFTVNPGPPSLSSVTPATGGQGSNVNVALAGTGFADGMTVNAGAGITVSNVNVASAASATATFGVAPSAAVGARSVTLTVSGQTSNSFTFNVVSAFPDLAITSTHAANFGVGFNEAYTIRVNNVGAASTTGTTTVTDILPAGLVPSSASGTGWSCIIAAQTVTCTSTTALGPGAASTNITLQVSVSSVAASTLTHAPTVTTTGDLNSTNNSAADITSIVPTPSPTFVFSPSTLVAGQQATVELTLASPFPHNVTGTLALSFSSNAAIPADDPAIQFASGGRQAAFTIAANSLQARFNVNAAEGPIGFQPGTIAGTLGFTGALQAGTVQTTFSPPSSVLTGLTIPLAAPSIQSVQTNTQNGFVAVVNLLSTMREVTQLSLTFNTTTAVRLSCASVTGCSVSGMTITFDVKGLFDSWFNSTSSFGSLSTLRLPLSFQGTIHGTVSVTLRNTQGISNSASFALP
jgi:hypothetical protein